MDGSTKHQLRLSPAREPAPEVGACDGRFPLRPLLLRYMGGCRDHSVTVRGRLWWAASLSPQLADYRHRVEEGDNHAQDFGLWLRSALALTGSPRAATLWRERRYRFAHRLGEALAGETETEAAISGPAVYGIWLRWGLLYVGQTDDASRRLRDLPIGESHHLANTFPPETWDRVVVIVWPQLSEAKDLTLRLGSKAVGLALEHRLQVRAQPLANGSRRTSGGGWRSVDRTQSVSLGARTAGQIDRLSERVQTLWDAAAVAAPESGIQLPVAVRCVWPGELLSAER